MLTANVINNKYFSKTFVFMFSWHHHTPCYQNILSKHRHKISFVANFMTTRAEMDMGYFGKYLCNYKSSYRGNGKLSKYYKSCVQNFFVTLEVEVNHG